MTYDVDMPNMVLNHAGFIILLVFLTLKALTVTSDRCLEKCKCIKFEKAGNLRYRVNCAKINNNLKNIRAWNTSVGDFLDLSRLKISTLVLLLSHNRIQHVYRGDFKDANMIQKLDLSKNKIKFIEDDAFQGMPNLRKIDLSDNKLSNLEAAMFIGVPSLQKLDLSRNRLFYIKENPFKYITSLKLLSLDDNPLICDCHLSWVPTWLSLKNIRLSQKTFCKYPERLQQIILRDLHAAQMNCAGPLEVPTFELNPSEQQLVFEGDAIILTCTVSLVPNITLFWSGNIINKSPPKSINFSEIDISSANSTVVSDDFAIEDDANLDDRVLRSTLFINELSGRHGGIWSCWASSPQGKLRNDVLLVVITANTTYCPEVITSGRKGTYNWPKTIAPNTVSQVCKDQKQSVVWQVMAEAHYSCGKNGSWINLDTLKCSFVSVITKVLQQFAERDDTLKIPEMFEELQVKGLHNYTIQNYNQFTAIDVNFVAVALMKYLKFVPKSIELDLLMLDTIDYVLRIDSNVLFSSQNEFKACSRLVQVTNDIPNLRSHSNGLSYNGENMFVKRFLLESYNFDKMTCMFFLSRYNQTAEQNDIKCFHYNLTASVNYITSQNQVSEAGVQFPVSLVKEKAAKESSNSVPKQLFHVSIFKKGSLFPIDGTLQQRVSSIVLTAEFANLSSSFEINNPIVVMLKTNNSSQDVPAWWNFSVDSGFGEWSTEGCTVERRTNDFVVFSCIHLSHYALLQNTSVRRHVIADFHDAPAILFPTMYIGSFICITCLMISLFIFIAYRKDIKMPAEAKHSLVNTWIAIILLFVITIFGIRFTIVFKVCQAIGLLINYFSLCVLLWIIVTLSNIYSKLSKPEVNLGDSSEDGSDQNIPQKPMIRFYLLGWGVPVIICGISAAVNLDLYASNKLCTLPIDQSVAAIFTPSALFVFVTACIFLRISCLLSDIKTGKLLQEVQLSSNPVVPTGNNDNDESNPNEIEIDTSEKQVLQEPDVEEDFDEEHSYSYQINAQVLLLFLYILSWGSGFLYFANPQFAFFQGYEQLIYSSLFCTCATVLGLFVFMSYCCFRGDVRKCLGKMLCLKVKDSLSSQQQSDITITTVLSQGEADATSVSKDAGKSVSPPPLEKAELDSDNQYDNHIDILSLDECAKALSERADKQLFVNVNHGKISPVVRVNGSVSRVDRQHTPLNRDSSNSVSSVATTERSHYTYHTMQSMNGFRSQSPFANLGHIHPISGPGGFDHNYYNLRQQSVARKFFQKQRDRRRKLNLQNIVKSESSQYGESPCLDTTIDTSLVIPKPQSEIEVPIVETICVPQQSDLSGNTSPVLENPPKSNQNGTLCNLVYHNSPANSAISNGHINHVSPPNRRCSPNECTTFLEESPNLDRPESALSLSKKSCQSECIGRKPQKRRRRRHKNSKGRGSSLSVMSNGSYSYPLRTPREMRKISSSKLNHSISDYEQMNIKNQDSTSSDDGEKNSRRPRSRQKNKCSSKKETSV